jgi:hypothetical protein
MSPEASDALRAAVNIARNGEIGDDNRKPQKVVTLRHMLLRAGHTPEAVDEALKFWANQGQEQRGRTFGD